MLRLWYLFCPCLGVACPKSWSSPHPFPTPLLYFTPCFPCHGGCHQLIQAWEWSGQCRRGRSQAHGLREGVEPRRRPWKTEEGFCGACGPGGEPLTTRFSASHDGFIFFFPPQSHHCRRSPRAPSTWDKFRFLWGFGRKTGWRRERPGRCTAWSGLGFVSV